MKQKDLAEEYALKEYAGVNGESAYQNNMRWKRNVWNILINPSPDGRGVWKN